MTPFAQLARRLFFTGQRRVEGHFLLMRRHGWLTNNNIDPYPYLFIYLLPHFQFYNLALNFQIPER